MKKGTMITLGIDIAAVAITLTLFSLGGMQRPIDLAALIFILCAENLFCIGLLVTARITQRTGRVLTAAAHYAVLSGTASASIALSLVFLLFFPQAVLLLAGLQAALYLCAALLFLIVFAAARRTGPHDGGQ